jgi:anti-sigma factor RsiW
MTLMTCGSARRILWAAPAPPRGVRPETQAAEAHVAACEACQAFVREQQDLAALIRAHAPRDAAPAEVRRRVFDAAARARAPRTSVTGWRGRFGRAAAVSIVVAGAALGMWLVGGASADEQWRGQLAAFADDHLDAGADLAVVSSDRAEIRAWLDQRLDFAVHVPRIPNAEFAGARLCAFAGRRAGVVCYRIDGQQVSLYLMASDATDPVPLAPAQLVGGGGAGSEVVAWQGAGLVHALAGRVDSARLRDMARYCLDVPAGRRRF